jgi:hypothetical protein
MSARLRHLSSGPCEPSRAPSVRCAPGSDVGSVGVGKGAPAVPGGNSGGWLDASHDAPGDRERFLAGAGVPARLRDTGITAAALTEIADHAMADWAITRVPRPVARLQLDELVKAAW